MPVRERHPDPKGPGTALRFGATRITGYNVTITCSASVFKIKYTVCWILWSREFFFIGYCELTNFLGEPTDMSAKTKALMAYAFAVTSVTIGLGASSIVVACLLLILRRKMSYMRLNNIELDVATKRSLLALPRVLNQRTPVLVVLCLYIALRISVRVNFPDPVVTKFPTGCPMGPSDPGCNRIALTNPSVALLNCVHCFRFNLYTV